MSEICPCSKQTSYSQCCKPFHQGQSAPTPEALMRSRYSAFSLGLADYLLSTIDDSFKKPEDRAQIQHTINTTKWLGLKVLHSSEKDTEGKVEFVAFLRDTDSDSGIHQLHESSNFKKVTGRWYYTDGSLLPPVKIKRNDSCICSSGKKFKKCCGA